MPRKKIDYEEKLEIAMHLFSDRGGVYDFRGTPCKKNCRQSPDLIREFRVSSGTAVGRFFISRYGISIAPWIGIISGVLAVLALLWRSYLDRFHKK